MYLVLSSFILIGKIYHNDDDDDVASKLVKLSWAKRNYARNKLVPTRTFCMVIGDCIMHFDQSKSSGWGAMKRKGGIVLQLQYIAQGVLKTYVGKR